jgi:hypothetical protein
LINSKALYDEVKTKICYCVKNNCDNKKTIQLMINIKNDLYKNIMGLSIYNVKLVSPKWGCNLV